MFHRFRTLQLRLVASACVICLQLVALAPHIRAQQNLTLGVLMPSLDTIRTVEPGYFNLLDATFRIVEWVTADINTNVALPAGYRFNLVYWDSGFARQRSVDAAIRGLQAGSLGLVGEWASKNTIPAALATPTFRMPMCGGASTSDELSNKVEFPLHFRLIPPDKSQGIFLAQVCKYLEWTSVNLMTVNEPYGLSLAKMFTDTAKALNITIQRSYLIQQNWALPSEFDPLLASLADSPSRITLFMGVPEKFAHVVKSAAKFKFGSDWTWVGGDAWVATQDVLVEYNLSAAEKAILDGLLFAWPAETAPGHPRYDLMNQRWQQQFGNTNFSTTSYALNLASCVEVLAYSWLSVIQREGLGRVLNRTYSPRLEDFIGTPRDTVSGRAVFTPEGDRNGTFELFNTYKGASKVFLRYSDGSFTKINEPIFANGLSTIPDGKVKYIHMYPSTESPGVQAVLGITGIAMALVLGSWCMIVYYRKSRRIRHLGLPFTAVLCIGLLVSLLTPFLAAGYPTDFTCSAQYWTLVLGFSLSLSSIWIRSYRIFKVFDNRVLSKSQSVKTSSLVRRMLILPIVQVVLLSIGQAQGPFRPSVKSVGAIVQYSCVDDSGRHIGNSMLYTASALDAAILVLLAWVSYKIRGIHTSFKDTVFIAYSIHNLIIAAIVSSAIAALFDGQSLVMYYVKSCGTLYANMALFSTMVFRHVYHLPLEARQARDGANAMNAMNDDQEDSSGIDDGTPSSGASGSVGTASQLGSKSIFAGVYAVKQSTGFFRRWAKCEVTMLQNEGLLSIFDPACKGSGRAVRVKYCILDIDPPDYPLCLAISCPGTDAFAIQFNSQTERSRWAAVMSTAGAAQRDASSGVIASMIRARTMSMAGAATAGRSASISAALPPQAGLTPAGLSVGKPVLKATRKASHGSAA
ncbi:periplasmic binding protein-like I [Catenaria anguillulae PL171]|uniref:Periplasmic binding protein-like I n=1 Tax=Catenaria anguillulae PL171 TaxID=765915 RepID=A0A1Y2HQ69_9FUNG|nr:periplasmic binding protein-like I [Catenaria anguillulae PL171]